MCVLVLPPCPLSTARFFAAEESCVQGAVFKIFGRSDDPSLVFSFLSFTPTVLTVLGTRAISRPTPGQTVTPLTLSVQSSLLCVSCQRPLQEQEATPPSRYLIAQQHPVPLSSHQNTHTLTQPALSSLGACLRALFEAKPRVRLVVIRHSKLEKLRDPDNSLSRSQEPPAVVQPRLVRSLQFANSQSANGRNNRLIGPTLL